jgi:hypothetical protein
LHTALHDEASVFDFAASVVPEDPPESVSPLDPLLPLEGAVVPLLLPLLPLPLALPLLLPVLVPLLPLPPAFPLLLPLLPVDAPAASALVDPLEPDPPSSLGEPVPLVLLLQAASPAVDDTPMTTTTWKSFSIFMRHTLPPDGGTGNLAGTCPGWNWRVSSVAHLGRPWAAVLGRPARPVAPDWAIASAAWLADARQSPDVVRSARSNSIRTEERSVALARQSGATGASARGAQLDTSR